MNLGSVLTTLALFFAVTSRVLASEQVFNELNFAFTPPDNWRAVTNASPNPRILIVAYAPPGGGRMLILDVDNRKPTGPVDDKFVHDFDDGVERAGGGKRISGGFIEVGGVKGFERVSNRLLAGRQTSSVLHGVLTSERFYSVEGISLKGAPDDPDLQKAMASCRFLTPATEPRRSPQSAAYQMGYLFGKYVIPGAVLLIAIVFVIIFVVSSALKNRRSKPPPMPPVI
jgi:hypothetical protein